MTYESVPGNEVSFKDSLGCGKGRNTAETYRGSQETEKTFRGS